MPDNHRPIGPDARSLIIRQVGNGFIVSPVSHPDNAVARVFTTMTDLLDHLSQHFAPAPDSPV